jgi:integrase
MSGRGSVFAYCACRDGTGKRYTPGTCPAWTRRGHRRWGFVVDQDKTWDATERRWRRAQLRRMGFGTRLAAERALEAELPAIRGHSAPSLPDRQLDLSTYLDRWLASDPGWRPATRDTYTKLVANHLRPALGRHLLTDLRPAHIREALARMTDGGLSRTTVHMAYSTLRTALNAAIRERVITWNPCQAVKVEGPAHPEMVVWEPHQVATFLAHAEQAAPHLAVAFQLSAWRGLRRGEVAGLRWGDVDLAAGTARIERNVTEAGGQLHTGEPKTARGKRTVSLGPKLVAALRAHRLAQPVRGLPPEDWVFTGPGGRCSGRGCSPRPSSAWCGSCRPCRRSTSTRSGTPRPRRCSWPGSRQRPCRTSSGTRRWRRRWTPTPTSSRRSGTARPTPWSGSTGRTSDDMVTTATRRARLTWGNTPTPAIWTLPRVGG